MANLRNDRAQEKGSVVDRLVRIVILTIVSFIVSIAAVSFAVHHMRLQFEGEFKGISDKKVHQVCDIAEICIDGDDFTSATVNSPLKYGSLLSLMMADTTSENLSAEGYGLFAYNNAQLSLLVSEGVGDTSEFAVANRDISTWLGSDEPTVVKGQNFESIILPIKDSTGMCVGVFEYKCTFDGLYELGNKLEGRILTAVIIAVVVGVVIFILQELIIKILRRRQGNAGAQVAESAKARDKRLISSTIGYCFAIILVVLLVMSRQLSSVYITTLESERADAMMKCAVSSSAALTYTRVSENMSYMLPIYSYAENKPYTVSVYTMAGDSFLRLYSSAADVNSTEQYYLTGVGDQYINCFQLQETAFTQRTEAGKSYVCAISPIISSENTVSGILEIMMPKDEFQGTLNGMSLSWIFTIVSIAISMGIAIFELNLIISTMSHGISGNTPVLVMYGENANRFLSFFAAFGSVMLPISFADYFKDSLTDMPVYVVHALIAVSLLLFIWGFFGFSSIRYELKSKLTSRVALIFVTGAGYFLALVAGIINIPYVTAAIALPVGFCFGMPIDFLRDYRINAGKLGYKDYSDRIIHNVQSTSYFLGVSVGTVITGICYERFGLLIVAVISGAALILTAVGMIYFMQNNSVVREAPLTVGSWLHVLSDSMAGRFLNSSFLMLGVSLSFMLIFIPNFLGNVGISLATSSFFYLVCAFSACVVCGFVKNHYEHILTSKVRVLIQSASTVLGLLVFAMLPSAKTLVVTSVLLGISLGIHDFYYIYALYLICSGRIRTNLRKCAEYAFYLGIGLMVPISMTAFMVDNVRIVMIIVTVLVALISFIYPASAYSSTVDESDPSLKPEPRRRPERNNAPMGNPYGQPMPQPQPQPAPVYNNPAPFGEAPQPDMQYQQMPQTQQYAPEQAYQQAPQQMPYYQQYYQQNAAPQQYAPEQPQYQQPYQQAPQQMPYDQQYYQQNTAPQQYVPEQPQYQQPYQQAPQQMPYDQQTYQSQNGQDMYGQSPYPQQPADPMAFLNDNDPGNGGV
ncbi:MAG: MFS transporter [Saccharofermentans sp.]|nr:MFS transporter [Saccharofermentans sp.]